jgi:outer membrane protein
MKKTLFTVLACVILSSAFAQFEQGRILIAGNSSFDLNAFSTKSKQDGNSTLQSKSFDIEFGPTVGYFVIDNLAIGANLRIETSKTTDEIDDSESTSTGLSFGPFARYYFGPIFGQLGVSVGTQKSEFKDGNFTTEGKFGTLGLGLGVGYAAMISDNVAIEPTLSYATTSLKPNEGDGKFTVSGISFGVGIAVYLGK